MTEMIEFAQARRSPSSNTNGEAEAEVETADPSPGLTFKSAEAGAATQVWAATTSGLEDHNGAYLADCGLMGSSVPTPASTATSPTSSTTTAPPPSGS